MLKYYHLKDAKMALGSHLLKHLVITKYGGVSWSQSRISRAENGKPCFLPASGSLEETPVEFNVSHQAGIVSLIAVVGAKGASVGTDVVCVDERIDHDYQHIDKSGFFDWVDVYADVFADSEVSFMKLGPVELDLDNGMELQGYGKDTLSRCQWRNRKLEIQVGDKTVEIDSNVVIDKKLRRFYGMWCLRETFVKMTGEALLAPWLKQLAISEVNTPRAKKGVLDEESLETGETSTNFLIQLKGKLLRDVSMELTALGKSYMVGGSIRTSRELDISDLDMGDWKGLDLESEVLPFGEKLS